MAYPLGPIPVDPDILLALIAAGVVLAFLLVVYVAARLWRYYVKVAPDPDRAAMLAGLGGGAAAYLVAGLFNSLTLRTSHTVLFWSFLALIELVGETRPWRPASRSREWRAHAPCRGLPRRTQRERRRTQGSAPLRELGA